MIVVFEGPVQIIVKEAEKYADTLPYGIAKAHNGTLQTKAAERGETGIDRIIILTGQDCYEFMRTNGVDPGQHEGKSKGGRGKRGKADPEAKADDPVIEVEDPANDARVRFQQRLEDYLNAHPTEDVAKKAVEYHRFEPVVAPSSGGPAQIGTRA